MLRGIREYLKLHSRWFTLPIKDGPLKGMKWIASSGTHFLKGTYEPEKTRVIMDSIKSGDTVWDIGGHVGYYSIIEARQTGSQGRVLVFEPRPLNASFIKRHLEINRISNVFLFPFAVSSQTGTARFESRTGTGTGHLSEKGNLLVETVTVDTLVATRGFPVPDFLKLDVEGGEIEVLRGATKTIQRHRPTVLVATHCSETHQFVLSFLDSVNYRVQILETMSDGDTEILALPPTRTGNQQTRKDYQSLASVSLAGPNFPTQSASNFAGS